MITMVTASVFSIRMACGRLLLLGSAGGSAGAPRSAEQAAQPPLRLSSALRRRAGSTVPARLMQNVSIDMAER
jgi:hypothetical protein